MADYRFDALKRLRGATFRPAVYRKPSDQWDHDHCEGCWAKFAEFDGSDILHEGYVYSERALEEPSRPIGDLFSKMSMPELADAPERHLTMVPKEPEMRIVGQPLVNGHRLHWLCDDCFQACRDALDFRIG